MNDKGDENIRIKTRRIKTLRREDGESLLDLDHENGGKKKNNKISTLTRNK